MYSYKMALSGSPKNNAKEIIRYINMITKITILSVTRRPVKYYLKNVIPSLLKGELKPKTV